MAKNFASSGDYFQAEIALRRGLAELPGHPVLSYALSIVLLRNGPSHDGWLHYENRWSVPFGPSKPSLSFPQWKGENVGSLIVLPEQGLGDQIMFSRYLPELEKRNIQATVVTPPPLSRLFEEIGAETQTIDGEVGLQRKDAWCFIGSLPYLTGKFPTAPYIRGSSAGEGVGLMLEGGPRFPGRSLPKISQGELEHLGISLHPNSTGARDFADTAEIIRGLRLVISVDTAVAHLAGAMGKPTWTLLPHNADWRWGRDDSLTQWYPSMRLFRQQSDGDWGAPIDQLKTALRGE